MVWFSRQKLMNRLARCLGRGEHDVVVRIAEDALREKPDDPIILQLMANSLDSLAQYERAATVRERILALQPDNKDVLYLLGRYHENRGRGDDALVYYSRLLHSREVTYPLTAGDFRFLGFLATMFGRDARTFESEARQTSEKSDREQIRRHVHAERYVAANGAKGPAA